MAHNPLNLLLVGGPTLLLEWHGLRILTDPTFDPAGSSYQLGPATLNKTLGPSIGLEQLGPIDVVLLSHDQHTDNLDAAGRALLPNVKQVLTTVSGAERLAGNSLGLAPWASTQLKTPDGSQITVTATPARHGPVGCEPICGDVIGFILQHEQYPDEAIYLSGDTVWYEGVAEVAKRFRVSTAILFLGAARLPVIGPDHLTMNAPDAILAAQAFPQAKIIPVHYDSWTHFSEGRAYLTSAFESAGIASRVQWLELGEHTKLS